MALETGTYISDLVATNPVASDAVATAQGHLNLIKSVLKNTFPNIKGAVSATNENLANGTPVGLIAMWSGTSMPAGWVLCNGQTVARADGTGNITTPNLQNMFIVGSGSSYATGNTGGIATNYLNSSQLPVHNHAASTDTQGAHGHTASDSGHGHPTQGNIGANQFSVSGGGGFPGVGTPYSAGGNTGTGYANITISNTDGNHAHNVTVQNAGAGSAVENRPPYYALAFIMKV